MSKVKDMFEPYDDDSVATALFKLREYIDRKQRTCITCWKFDMKTELCKHKDTNARPPATIIARGCKNHELIPF